MNVDLLDINLNYIATSISVRPAGAVHSVDMTTDERIKARDSWIMDMHWVDETRQFISGLELSGGLEHVTNWLLRPESNRFYS